MSTHPVLMTLGRQVRHLREQRSWSMRELARKASVSVSTVSRIENVTGDVWLSAVALIADALGLGINDLVTPAPCEWCMGSPPAGFSCNACGRGSLGGAP